MIPVEFTAAAKGEMQDASAFYEKKSLGLGQDFINEIERLSERIAAFPESGQKISDNVRRLMSQRFPYGILYVLETKIVLIVAVMHLNRKPDYWKERLK